MSLDFNQIQAAVVRLCNAGVGSLLSSNPGAAIQENQNKQRPKYPYISVSFPDIVDESGWETVQYVNESNHLCSATVKQLILNISCFGEGSSNILNRLQGYLRRAYVRDSLRSLVKVGVVGWGDIRSLPKLMADKNYVDSAEFILTLNAVDVDEVTDEDNNQLIEGIDLTGELHRHEGDENPLEINVTAP